MPHIRSITEVVTINRSHDKSKFLTSASPITKDFDRAD